MSDASLKRLLIVIQVMYDYKFEFNARFSGVECEKALSYIKTGKHYGYQLFKRYE